MEHAAVKPGRALKKQQRGRYLAAGCRRKLKDWTQDNGGYWKKLAAVHRKMTRRAGVAQCKGHIIRKNQTRDKVASGTWKGRMLGRRHLMNLEAAVE
jgi:hypothetical protein